ncbi:FAD-dependent oxidoreductase [Romeria aff. gracilis LEGE 07310]|uniref:FAD-dependent oxidoreductase n=1 Tax=Vasconcelosia minhoensis LEGE 07310 TaxID=915328 RepID=A0A8J7A934_9CYAN|nr:FAD-dependent oxidoreductase [Romeria gracilis]MBE9079517.1 FAD-dependent oxidoreductase [Romeria aff. gracilis LEGE 07310]
MWDVIVIGAGLAGLVCARELRAVGYRVCVLDKSRGVGGRMATRRVKGTRVDHGLRYWNPKTPALQPLTEELLAANVLAPWAVTAFEIPQPEQLVEVTAAPVCVAPEGMSAIAKHLAANLEIQFQQRVTALERTDTGWRITYKGINPAAESVTAKAVVVAIPGPQAVPLLKSIDLPQRQVQLVEAVEYETRLTLMAGYPAERGREMGPLTPSAPSEGWMVTDNSGTSITWIGLDSSKRHAAPYPTIVIQSKPGFADRYLDARDLQPAASVLLRAAGRKLLPWIAEPDWFQIHRWRYAYVTQAYPGDCVRTDVPLVCCGDWCRSPSAIASIDAAFSSGMAAQAVISSRI